MTFICRRSSSVGFRSFFLVLLLFAAIFGVPELMMRMLKPTFPASKFYQEMARIPHLIPIHPVFTEFKIVTPSENYITLTSGSRVKENIEKYNITPEIIQGEADDLRRFAASVRNSRPPKNLQYDPDTFGIVINCYKKAALLTFTNLIYLANAFEEVHPLEIWVDSGADMAWAKALLDRVYPAGYGHVRVLSSVTESMNKLVGELQPLRSVRPFYTKLHAILASKFQRVLFIDCDAFLLQSPLDLTKMLREKNVPAATWLDSYGPEADNPFFKAVNIPKKPGTGLESGVMYIDKKYAWDAMLVSCRMNHRHQFYYRLFHGDKDLYYFAFNLTNKVLLYPPYVPGRIGINGTKDSLLGGVFIQPGFEGKGAYLHLTTQKNYLFSSLISNSNILLKALIYNGNKAHIKALKDNHYGVVCDNKDDNDCAKIIDAEEAIGNFNDVISASYRLCALASQGIL